MTPDDATLAYEEASIEIDAPPEAVYTLVSSIGRMGEWSPEAVGGDWTDGGSGQVGDWFTGHNVAGERRWSRECEVARAEPGRDFTFVVGGIEANRTWWSYEMAPSTTGTTLTERWWIVNKSPALLEASDEQFAQRVALTRRMLVSTLEALKATAEAEPTR